jgi:hypothetical protein
MLRANLYRDANGNVLVGALPPSDTIYAIELAANVSQRIALPSGANLVVFSVSGGSDFYVKFVNAAIAVPSGNITDGSAPELNPEVRQCSGCTYVSLVSPVACVLTMSFYS